MGTEGKAIHVLKWQRTYLSCVASQLLILAPQVIPKKTPSQHPLCLIWELITAQSIPGPQSKATLKLSETHCSILHWLLLISHLDPGLLLQ